MTAAAIKLCSNGMGEVSAIRGVYRYKRHICMTTAAGNGLVAPLRSCIINAGTVRPTVAVTVNITAITIGSTWRKLVSGTAHGVELT